MAQFTRGITFASDEVVTPTKLNNLVDLGTLTGLGASNFAGGLAGVFFYGPSAPTIVPGRVWYDNGVGREALYWSVQSPSAHSISRWLRAGPWTREGLFWSESAVSLGFPHFLTRGQFFTPPGDMFGVEARAFDGLFLPRIWLYNTSSGGNPAVVIPTESTTAAGPVACALAGFFAPRFGTGPIAAGDPVWISYTSLDRFGSGSPVATRGYVLGTQFAGQSDNDASIKETLFWGGIVCDDIVA